LASDGCDFRPNGYNSLGKYPYFPDLFLRRTVLKKLISIFAVAIALFGMAFATPAFAGDAASGAKVFSANCAACHAGGNNLVVANKTLKKEALEQFGMKSAEAIVTQVTNGKGAMPAFGGRLTGDQIADVAAYVLSQAESGW
jgi:cytochrome c6